MKINLTIPVYNEQKYLETQINKALHFFNKNLDSKFNLEIIIANNGSNDLTSSISDRLSINNHNVKTIKINQKGIGIAIKTSWEKYNYDILAYTDLDFSIDLSHIIETINILSTNKNIDIISGSRYNTDSIVLKRSFIRTFLSKSYNLLLNIFLNANFNDGACGYKFIKNEPYNKIKKNIRSQSFFFSTELLLLCQHNKLNIYNQSVLCIENSPSKIKIVKTSFHYLISIIKFKIRNKDE